LRVASRTEVWLGRRRLTYFGGCDYFRFSVHPQVLAAAIRAAQQFGLGVAASRRTTGNHPLYEQFEGELADFCGAEAARLVSTGYAANLVVAQALAHDFTHLLIDAGAHPSLHDAATFFAAQRLQFRAGDTAEAVRLQAKLPAQARCLVLTDGIGATDGAAAPLAALRAGLRPETWLLVDDCHGLGTVGRTGRGSLELAGIDHRQVLHTGTLSKALGAFGGVILGDRNLIQRVTTSSPLFTGSTPPPLPLVAAAKAALARLRTHPGPLRRLHAHVAQVKQTLWAAGRLERITPGPICRVVPRDDLDRKQLTERLLKADIFPSFLDYPGLPSGGAFRFGLSSEHTRAQLRALIQAVTGD
jgi:7-keto-8-aminopelargonate synthetase-like enzyme